MIIVNDWKNVDAVSGIYKIENPEGLIYIGQSINLRKRIRDYTHKSPARQQPLLRSSLIKYGYENHVLCIVAICDPKELNVFERSFQDRYKNKSLNVLTVTTRSKTGAMCDDTRFKLMKKVYVFDLDGKYVKEYETSEAAARSLKVSMSSIRKACLGEVKQIKGYQLRRSLKSPEKYVNKRFKGCNQYTKEGIFLKSFTFLKDASSVANPSKISEVCRGKRNYAGGFKWSYNN